MSTKKLGIMQPYFLPYIGYFQLISAVDAMVIYDDIQFVRKGWVNRNRMLQNGKDVTFSIPLKKDSDYLDIRDRFLDAQNRSKNHGKIVRMIENNYRKAPYFQDTFPLIKELLLFEEDNLFKFVFNSIDRICEHLQIDTPLIVSSPLNTSEYKKEERVLKICSALEATTYINPIGGVELYDKADFESKGFELNFLKTNELVYDQKTDGFVPYLSILDVLMFLGKDATIAALDNYNLR